MSGVTANLPGGLHSLKHRDNRGTRPSQLNLARGKRVLLPASIAFLLSVLVPFLVFSQSTARTLSGIVTSEAGSRIPSAHLSIRNTATHDIVSVIGKEEFDSGMK